MQTAMSSHFHDFLLSCELQCVVPVSSVRARDTCQTTMGLAYLEDWQDGLVKNHRIKIFALVSRGLDENLKRILLVKNNCLGNTSLFFFVST